MATTTAVAPLSDIAALRALVEVPTEDRPRWDDSACPCTVAVVMCDDCRNDGLVAFPTPVVQHREGGSLAELDRIDPLPLI